MWMTSAENGLVGVESGPPGWLRAISAALFWTPRHIVDSAWLEHGPFAFWLMEALRPGCFVELGSHRGFSYFALCRAVQQLGLETLCFAVDPWKGDPHASFYGQDVYAQGARTNAREYSASSSLLRMRFDEALRQFAEGSIDLLHIDDFHTYDAVRHDFETWEPKLSRRGVVISHDVNVRERDFGVWRLWEELAEQYLSFFFEHGYGLGVLAVGLEVPLALSPLLKATPEAGALIRAAYARLGAGTRLTFEAAEHKRRIDEPEEAQWENRYREIVASEAWRLTAPLRALGKRFPGFARFLQQVLNAIW